MAHSVGHILQEKGEQAPGRLHQRNEAQKGRSTALFVLRYLLGENILGFLFSFLEEIAEDVFIVLFTLLAFEAGELLKEMFLLRRQIGGRDHLDNHMLIAAS